jgi:DNA-binding PucR family transcriptional regulator
MDNRLTQLPTLPKLNQPSVDGAWFVVLFWSRHMQALDAVSLEQTLGAFLEVDVTVMAWFDQVSVALLPISIVDDELGEAIQEVVLSELGYEVDLAIQEVADVARDFEQVANQLVQTIALGRQFQPNRYVHVSQQLVYAQVLGAVERTFASEFVVDMQSRFAEVDDEEMWATIEAFLASNQNVSETAKRLYVHRNTLIYRLDRFKAATGLDVRLFEDAVVVKLYRSLVIGVRNLY